MEGSGEGLPGHPELSHVHRCSSACPLILGVTEAQEREEQVWDKNLERDHT